MEKLNRKGFFSTLFGGIAGVVAGSSVKASEPITPETVVYCDKLVFTHSSGASCVMSFVDSDSGRWIAKKALSFYNEYRTLPTLVILGWAAVVTVPAVVALVAAPVNAPTKVVDVTLDKPATVVVVPPNVKVVLPNVIVLFASLACANVPLEILVAFNADIDDPLPEKELALTKLTPEI